MSTPPKTQAERSRASEARSIKAGAVRMPGGLLSTEAARALADLVASGYAASKTAVIERALLEAKGKHLER
ncbi:hypothetical protein [Comamonas serinivorans]|uniref:hypothetical protein n=1 Tax=Comamonas serinivorans TaxID=1082851 RepID=UPI0012FC29FA|nr:hypothetical protein [Comamonas serinivorans]